MSENKRILIVGGVAGGASAAARARRLSEGAQIVLFERGEHISFANCGLPYHIGGEIADRSRLLVQTPAAMTKRFNIDVRTRTEVVSIDRQAQQIVARDLNTAQEFTEHYDALILSPGAEPVRPPIPGATGNRVFTLRSLRDMDAIKAFVDVQKPARAVVIGGGYIGLEMVEAMARRDIAVTLVQLPMQVMSPADPEMAAPLHQHLTMHGVDLRLGTSVASITEQADGLVIELTTGETFECGIAIMAVGVRPDVALARAAGLTLGPTGGIAVDEHMRTSDEHIYAVGDAVEVVDFVSGQPALIPLAGPANRQGRIAADNIFGRESVYRRTQGTAICKVFDLTIGMTGLSEKALKRLGRSYEKVYVHPSSHASYYPGATPISLKLLFDPQSGKVLGAQAVGSDGVDKRIDVLAVAIRAGMSVFDLADLELSYAPPYGSAKDPVNYAGFVASNAIKGEVAICHAADALSPAGRLLLDVRTPSEVQAGTIPGAINIPLDDLRGRLGELPRDREILAFCQVGLRGYLACRILSQNGFTCRNLSGGYKTFLAATVMPQLRGATATSFVAVPAHLPERARLHTTQPWHPIPAVPGTEALPAATGGPVKHVDATGLQCPGPIMKLKAELETIQAGQSLTIAASDAAFAPDVAAWCHSTGNELLDIKPARRNVVATVRKSASPAPGAAPAAPATLARNKTLVVFSADFDKVMAAFIIANGAAAMGSDVTMFFTFWGLNALRRPTPPPIVKNIIERMFGWIMPRGADRLGLSRMNMGGAGLAMIKGIMRKKNVPSLPELIASAQAAGVKLVACAMSMDLMGIKKEELIDGVQEGGVAMYLDRAEAGNVNLFI